jgi:hypothetical protein
MFQESGTAPETRTAGGRRRKTPARARQVRRKGTAVLLRKQ